MLRLEKRDFAHADESAEFPTGRYDSVVLGNSVITRCEAHPGWHWVKDIQPLEGTPSCAYDHVGYIVEGQLGIRMDDGREMEFAPGEVFAIPAGHDAWAVGDVRLVFMLFEQVPESEDR